VVKGEAACRHRGPVEQAVVGALLEGLVADWLGMAAAIHVVAALTLMSGLVAMARMRGTLSASR